MALVQDEDLHFVSLVNTDRTFVRLDVRTVNILEIASQDVLATYLYSHSQFQSQDLTFRVNFSNSHLRALPASNGVLYNTSSTRREIKVQK